VSKNSSVTVSKNGREKKAEVIINSVGKKKMKKRKVNEMRICGGR